MTNHMAHLARRTAEHSEFMGYLLARHMQLHDVAFEEDHAAQLGISKEQWTNLALCRRPRPDRWAEDIKTVADYVGIDAALLERTIRDAEPQG